MDLPTPNPAPKPLAKVHGHSLIIVRLIAADKFVKGTCLIVIGTLILHHLDKHQNQSVYEMLRELVNAIRVDENNFYIHELLERSLGVSRETMHWFSIGTLIYAGLYFIEGFGLLFDQAWAEWMVIIGTAGFIPLEIYEIWRHPTIIRGIIFVLNVLILIYISMRLRWRHLAKLEARARGVPIVTRDTTHAGIKP